MRLAILITALAAPVWQLLANAPEVIPLWRDLNFGDAPSVVAAKLSAHPNVRSAKVKETKRSGQSVAVTYRGGGIEILGQTFQIVPVFELGSLKRVGLGTQPGCANRAFDEYNAMLRTLRDKYPTVMLDQAGPSRSEIGQAVASGTDSSPASVERFLSNGQVVVLYQLRLTAAAPPPSGYSTNAKVNALARLLWNQYEARARECEGTGKHRMQHLLIYMTSKDYDAQMEGAKDRDALAQEAAKSNL